VVHRSTWPCEKTTKLKTFRHQDFHGFHLGTYLGYSNPHISKNYDFHFSQKLSTKPSSNAVVHRPTWPCAKSTELKTFVHHEFYDIHLETFVDHSNIHIWKTKNFIFFTKQRTKPSSLVVVHRLTWPCAKSTELKTFMHQKFNGIRLGTFVGHSNLHI